VQKSQQNDLPVWEFEGIMMGVQDCTVDLTKNGSPVVDRAPTPGPQTLTPDFFREG